jgi:hypothetical protein
MASLLNDDQKAVFTTALDTLFDTFKQDIIIYKEAKIQITNINQPRLFGYDEEVDISNINYIPITGTFSAMVNFNKKQKLRDVREVNSFVEQGEASIKVKSDARDFIDDNGKTLNISIGDVMFKIVSSESLRRFISPNYFIYYLERDI